MKAVTKIMTGAAGIAALVGMAAPAAAQYPGYYPGYNQGTNVIGQVLQSVLNPYGQQQYGMHPQQAAQQCSAAVQSRLAQSSYGNAYNPYGGYGQYGGYGNPANNARVVSISQVEPRSSTTTRVRGYATSGMYAGYGGGPYAGYGGYSGYGGYGGYNAAQQADLTFKCDIDYRGYIRDIDINRRY